MEQRPYDICNRCDNQRCHKFTTHGCKLHKPLQPFTVKLIMVAAQHDIKGIANALNMVGLEFQETGRYPYFRLIEREES